MQVGGLADVMRDEMKPRYPAETPYRFEIPYLCMAMAMAMAMALDFGPAVFQDQSRALAGRADQTATLAAFKGPAPVLMGEHGLLNLLRSVNTPTVCNAIETVQGWCGFDAFSRGTMGCTEPGRSVVGYVMAAQIAALAPPTESLDVIRAQRMAYYRAMHDAPKPSVAVVEDMDYPNLHRCLLGQDQHHRPQGIWHVRRVDQRCGPRSG